MGSAASHMSLMSCVDLVNLMGKRLPTTEAPLEYLFW